MEINKWSDPARLNKLQQGQQEIFHELYDDFAPILYSAVVRLVKGKEAQELLLEKIFIRIARRMASFDRRKQSLFTWIFAILQEQLLDYHENS